MSYYVKPNEGSNFWVCVEAADTSKALILSFGFSYESGGSFILLTLGTCCFHSRQCGGFCAARCAF